MRFRIVLDIIGTLLKILGLLLLVPGIVSAIYHETSGIAAFALTSLLSLSTGIVLSRLGTKGDVGYKEAFAAVTLGWLCAAFFGALPFVFQGLSFVDGLFESISGFSATGATILTESNAQGYYIVNATLADRSISADVAAMITGHLSGNAAAAASAALSHPTFMGLLFWRSFQQLVGGLGIILLVVAIFPQLHVAGRQLFRAETVGPSKDTLVPRAAETARILWGVYLLFNGLEIVMLAAGGMPLYDAVCTAFSTLATGGFSPQSSSLVAYHSPVIDAIVAAFIILGMSSFSLHYRVLTTDRLAWFKDEEFRFMITILALGTLVLFFFGGIQGDILTTFRFASFQVISFMGTCGFVNTLDYDKWTTAAKLALIMVMLVGGCIGSTAGAIKVGRLRVALKYAYNELIHMIHPRALMQVRLGGDVVREDVLRPMLFYAFFYLATFFALSLALAMVEFQNPKVDLLVVTSGVASCMGGVGPGFGIITFDWSQISPLGKMIGFFCMYIGRLELMPIFLLFVPELWRK
ncbi:MAG TPA: TrkH family potassium uptake protein [Methanotrichaceae archaeon]|nr:TrkH family potassium uptake protein [Methanotrichaceae archaeon]